MNRIKLLRENDEVGDHKIEFVGLISINFQWLDSFRSSLLDTGLKVVQKCFKCSCVGLGVFCLFVFVMVFFDIVGFFSFLLQVLNEKKLQEVDSLWKEFETPEKANKM